MWVAITQAGDWWLTAGKASGLIAGRTSSALAHGTLSPPPKAGADGVAWTAVELSADGQSAKLLLNSKIVASKVAIPAGGGNVAVGSATYSPAYFDDFTVSATRNAPPPPPPPGPGPSPPPPPLLVPASASLLQLGSRWVCGAARRQTRKGRHGSMALQAPWS